MELDPNRPTFKQLLKFQKELPKPRKPKFIILLQKKL